MKTTLRYTVAGLLGALLLPMLALAQVDASVRASANTSQDAARITKAKEHADQEITRRTAALNAMLTRIDAMTKVTPEFKANLKANTQTQINGLAALKVKIDGEADQAALRTEIQSITGGYRIFALVMPQARIAAAADREATVIGMLVQMGGKLQARIQTAQQGGASVDALTSALADMGAKLQDAQAQAQAAVTGSATLTPDGGDKTKMEANKQTLKTAAEQIKTAQKDIVAARADAEIIIKGLRTLGVGASASTTLKAR